MSELTLARPSASLVAMALMPVPERAAPRDIRADVARALLGDALLSDRDLPGWHERTGATEASLFDRSSVGAALLGEVRRRFVHPRTGQVIEQHVGILPQWSLRYFSERAEEGAPLEQADASTRMMGAGDQAFADSVVRRYPEAVHANAIFLRRHGLVMALATWQFGEKREGAPHTRQLATVADRVWAPIADALFTPGAVE